MVSVPTGATVYFDTNALIYLTEGAGALKESLDSLVQTANSAQARFVTRELAITEVLARPIREGTTALVAAYDELFDAFVYPLPIERTTLVRAAQLRAARPRLRTPDAIHIASAERSEAKLFVTGDAGIVIEPPMSRVLLS